MPSKAKQGGIIWDNPLPINVAKFDEKLDGYIQAGMKYQAPKVQTYSRENAPWTDRTANARNGLFAKDFKEERGAGERGAGGHFLRSGAVYGIVLYHTMPYGIFLEVRWSGRYAIIRPTIAAMAPPTMELLRGIIGRMR